MTETITLNGTAMTAVDVEQDMRRHKNTQTRMQAQIRVLQHEQNELVRRLTLSQVCRACGGGGGGFGATGIQAECG